jgi:hypothetical protein
LTYAIIQFSLYRKTAKEVNDKLKSSTGINRQLFETMPILGCYVLRDLEDMEMWGIPKYKPDLAKDVDEKRKVDEYMNGVKNQAELNKFKEEYVTPLVKLADGRVFAAPYLLAESGGKSLRGMTFEHRFRGVWL